MLRRARPRRELERAGKARARAEAEVRGREGGKGGRQGRQEWEC